MLTEKAVTQKASYLLGTTQDSKTTHRIGLNGDAHSDLPVVFTPGERNGNALPTRWALCSALGCRTSPLPCFFDAVAQRVETAIRDVMRVRRGALMAEVARGRRSVGEAAKSTPSRIRTYDLRIRSPLLYPTELWAQDSCFTNSFW